MKKIIILLGLCVSNIGAMDRAVDKPGVAPVLTHEEIQAILAKNERWQELNKLIEHSKTAGERAIDRLSFLQEKKEIEENIKSRLRGETKPLKKHYSQLTEEQRLEQKAADELKQRLAKLERAERRRARARERYATDLKYAEKRRAGDRERYATNPERRARRKKNTQQLATVPPCQEEREREYERASNYESDSSSSTESD